MSRPVRVILVDDEEDFRIPVARYLTRGGMTVTGVESVEALEVLLETETADVIVLDVNLPGESGLDAVDRLRRRTTAGLIMLTARSDVEDRIIGLRRGADGYLGKPVDLRELAASIRNLAERLAPPPVAEGWSFDGRAWTLTTPQGLTIALTQTECLLIATLVDHAGEPVAREVLADALGLTLRDGEDRRLDVVVSRLRAKVRDAGALPIRAVRNVGYVFPLPVSRLDAG